MTLGRTLDPPPQAPAFQSEPPVWLPGAGRFYHPMLWKRKVGESGAPNKAVAEWGLEPRPLVPHRLSLCP